MTAAPPTRSGGLNAARSALATSARTLYMAREADATMAWDGRAEDAHWPLPPAVPRVSAADRPDGRFAKVPGLRTA